MNRPLLFLMILTVSTATIPRATAQGINFQNPNYDRINQAIIKETNARRAQNRLPPLTYSKQLTEAAQSHSNDMARMKFFSHDNPYDANRRSMGQRIAQTGYEAGHKAENIAESFGIQYVANSSFYPGPSGSGEIKVNGVVVPAHTPQTLAKSLLDMWMKSPGHRRNILSNSTKELGTGVAFYKDGSLNNAFLVKACQVFGEPNVAASGQPTPDSGPPTTRTPQSSSIARGIDFQSPNYEQINQAIIKETNARRAQNGQPPLAYSKQLTVAAQSHSNDMVSMKFFSHDNPHDGNRRTMGQRIAQTGYKSRNMSENIAQSSAIQYKAGTNVEFSTPGSGKVKYNGVVVPPHTPQTLAKDLLDMWMNSPGHRRNILSSNTEIGCGVAFYRDGSLNNAMLVKACQVFGEPEPAEEAKPMESKPTEPKPSAPIAEKSSFPKGYFYMTNKYVEGQDYVLESAPVTLRKRGNYSGMVWKAIPAGNGYFFLTTQYLEGKNQVLEGGDGQGPAVMVPNKGYSGTMWKPISAGGGYFYLTSAYMESQKKVLEGNVGDANADPRDTVYKGAPHMVTGNPTGTMWKFIPAN